MRAILVLAALCAVAALAAADSKTRELAQGYERELAACRTRADGVAKVATGAQALVDGGQKQYEADLAALRDGLAQVQAYCAELTATLEILADPGAKYRSLERKLDEQDNKIRKLRQTSKKVLDDLAPVISRLIPAINARVGQAAPAPKKLRLKFPSERAVDGPALGSGTFRTSGSETSDIVEYSEAKASATLTTKLVAGATCEQQRKAVTATDASDVAATDATRSLGLAWYMAYAKATRRLRVACRMTKAGAIVATLDDPLAASAWPDLEPLLAAMIAARP